MNFEAKQNKPLKNSFKLHTLVLLLCNFLDGPGLEKFLRSLNLIPHSDCFANYAHLLSYPARIGCVKEAEFELHSSSRIGFSDKSQKNAKIKKINRLRKFNFYSYHKNSVKCLLYLSGFLLTCFSPTFGYLISLVLQKHPPECLTIFLSKAHRSGSIPIKITNKTPFSVHSSLHHYL